MRVYSSKTSMSDACFHNFDFNRMIYKAISTDDLPSALANLRSQHSSLVYSNPHSPPSEDSAILCELFGQSFANRFVQNRDFFSTHHREHTILLSRERVNKGTKRMNSLRSPHLISSTPYAILLGKPLLTNPA